MPGYNLSFDRAKKRLNKIFAGIKEYVDKAEERKDNEITKLEKEVKVEKLKAEKRKYSQQNKSNEKKSTISESMMGTGFGRF